ncbi:MAG TPA: proton-conducting transporter membrane subunit [Atribacteraceae bacterium]|nr:proton-conducting transporter membrane subunit [Atribacteraceae bacterium]
MNLPLVMVILLPLVAAGPAALLSPRLSRWSNLVIASLVLLQVVLLITRTIPEGGLFLGKILGVDFLSALPLLFVNVLSVGFCIFALSRPSKTTLFYYCLTLAFINGTLVGHHLVLFIMFWGLSGAMLYFYGILRVEARRIARKAFLVSALSDAFLIFALSVLAKTGDGLPGIKELQMESGSLWNTVAYLALAFAAFAKAGCFPLHTWIPTYCEKSPMESVYILPASWDKLIGIYLLARLLLVPNAPSPVLPMVIAVLGASTIVIGVMMALVQHNGRRLLGYHAVSQTGYMVLGLASGTAIGIAGGLLHMVNHSIYKSTLFMSLGNVEDATGTGELQELGGLYRRMPGTFIGALISALSITGLPPTNGFISKGLVYSGVLLAASKASGVPRLIYLVCLAFALLGTAMTMASFLKFMYTVFLGKGKEDWSNIREKSVSTVLPLLLNASLCLLIGLFWKSFPLGILRPVVSLASLSNPGSYSFMYTIAIKYLPLVAGGFFFYLFFRLMRYKQLLDQDRIEDPGRSAARGDFFHEIRDMAPLAAIYTAAERRWFDLFEIINILTKRTVAALRILHTGVLSFYSIWIVLGFGVITLFLFFLRGG